MLIFTPAYLDSKQKNLQLSYHKLIFTFVPFLQVSFQVLQCVPLTATPKYYIEHPFVEVDQHVLLPVQAILFLYKYLLKKSFSRNFFLKF